MAKQTINVGETANDRQGDSLRSAFQKVNANFTELYTQLGLDELPLNLGAFEFSESVNGVSTISTTDSSAVIIDQATIVTSDLTVGGDIVPTVAQGGDLGSAAKPWRSLYVSGNTIFIGNVPVTVDGQGNLLVNGAAVADVGTAAWDNVTGKPTFAAVATSGSYADLSNRPAVPADINDLTDTGNLLFDGDYGNLTNQPVIPTDVSDLTDTTNLFFDRSYLSLTDTPTIPADIGDLTDTGLLLSAGFSGSYNDLTDTPAIPADVSDLTDTGNLLSGGAADSLTSNDDINIAINNDDSSSYVWNFGQTGDLTLPAGGDILDSTGTSVLGGAASLSITIPGDAYKGFGARYGRVYGNSNSNELTVSKIVIFKEAAETTSTIHPTSSEDDFAVSGLGDSDVVAMFVLYGDTNAEKSLDTLKTFARAAIDTVLLNGGVAGQFNTIAAMRSAFYNNIGTLTTAAGGLVADFEFFEFNTQFSVSFNTSGQGTGTGFNVDSLSYNLQNDTLDLGGWSNGTGYTQGDQIVIPGTSITYDGNSLLSPDNDITVTITAVNVSGLLVSYTVSGTLPRPPGIWRNNSISDGGNDQYDTANFINTNLANQISYNGGVIVENAAAQFGSGSKYVVVYDSSVFGIFATGSSATTISTSGNSGADGASTTDTGELFTTDRTYDPALTNLTLTNDPLRAVPVNFVKADYATANDVDVIEDDSTLQIGITRDVNNGIYNPFTEEEWDEDVSPQGTLWSVGNTDELSDIETRAYTNFYAAYGSGGLGDKIPGSTAVMYVPSIEKYYLIEWNSWTQSNAGGGFSYTRTEIDVAQVEQGIQFSDGTRITSAEGLGRVKSTAPGSRRIEEVVGYKEVSVTEKITNNLTTVASRSGSSTNLIWIDSTATTIDEIIDNPANYNNAHDFEFSLDNITWYTWTENTSFSGNERGYSVPSASLNYNQGDTVYFRYKTGGDAVAWWNKSELPGGSSNFRGAIIDYHAYTGESTIIGTIHIVDDDGEEHISHQEVQSGGTDGENDDLWLVISEGQIHYRRIDGESKTLKIHWTAKVFYGSELYD